MNYLLDIHYSRRPGIRILKFIAGIIVLLYAGVSLFLSVQPLIKPYVYQKDFIQEYLLAQAVFLRIDPYIPLPDLAGQVLGPIQVNLLPHPNVHPPPVALISLPYGLLGYQVSATAWYIFEVVCLAMAIRIFLKYLISEVKPLHIWASVIIMLLWSPVRDELVVGQLMSLLLLLLTVVWITLRNNRDILGGILLGSVLAIKLIAWPVILYLLIMRRWKAVCAAGIVFFLANIITGILMGFDNVAYYYLEVGKTAVGLYQNHERNFSLWTLGFRVFEGTFSTAAFSLQAPPLVYLPTLARITSIILLVIVLITVLWKTMQSRDFDVAFGSLVPVCIMLSPVAWSHYYVLLMIPIVIIFKSIKNYSVNKNEMVWSVVVVVTLFLAFSLRSGILVLSGQPIVATEGAQASFLVPMLTFLVQLFPLFGLIGLLLQRRIGNLNSQKSPE